MSKKTLQLTIDFLYNKSDNYFCFKWVSREIPEYPYFSCSRLDNNNFSFGFLNKLIHLPILLSGNIKSRNDKIKIELPMPNEIPIYSNIHFLKSHLQKCIRLKKDHLAIPTAKHLLELNPIQFIRRLAIIFVEDCMITQHYSILIWMMIAISSNNFHLQLHHKEWLLGLVYIACKCPYKESYEMDDELDKMSDEKLAKHISDLSLELDKHKHAVIQSLIIRSAYGGMQGDTRLLLKAAYIWCKRFQLEDKRWEKYYKGEVRTISYSVLPLQKADWVLSAIDYHCFPKMLDWLMEELELSEEKLKQLIWDNSSKINYRENYDGKKETKELNKEDWEKVRKQVQSIARYAIKNYS